MLFVRVLSFVQIGGILLCGITHTAITPLDVSKCNMQVSPEKYKTLMGSIRLIMAEEGAAGLLKGWAPTAIGYSLQGAGKFGLYEVFKDVYSTALGEEKSYEYRSFVYAAASGSGEVFADIMLCPMEMVKVRFIDKACRLQRNLSSHSRSTVSG